MSDAWQAALQVSLCPHHDVCMQGDAAGAKAVFKRVLQIAISLGGGVAIVVFLLRFVLPKMFTSDAAVIQMAGRHLPILAWTMVSLSKHLAHACPAQQHYCTGQIYMCHLCVIIPDGIRHDASDHMI